MVFFSLIFVLISGVAATHTHGKTSVKTPKSYVTCVGNGYKVYMLCFIALSFSAPILRAMPSIKQIDLQRDYV